MYIDPRGDESPIKAQFASNPRKDFKVSTASENVVPNSLQAEG